MTPKSARILIVDDDPDMRFGLNVRLRAHSYDTAYAADGVSVMTQAVKSKPDLILLDLGLPAGDGYVVMNWLRQHPCLSCVPVVVLSARDAGTHRDRALRAGAREFLEKPVGAGRLLEAIGRHVTPR